jgi:hypothetical protein
MILPSLATCIRAYLRDHLTRLGGEADSSAPSAEISALAQMAIRKPFMARMVANSSRGNCPLLYTAFFTALGMIPYLPQ